MDDSKVEHDAVQMDISDVDTSSSDEGGYGDGTKESISNTMKVISMPPLTFTKETTRSKGLDKKMRKWFKSANSNDKFTSDILETDLLQLQ